MSLKKRELEKIWKQLDGCCEALERLSHDEVGNKLLDEYENRIDMSAINMLKNEIEELIEQKSRKPINLG
jgi:hypothetical protein